MDDRRRFVRLALVALGTWLVVSVPSALELREYAASRYDVVDFPRLLAISLLRYLPLALWVPVLYELTRRLAPGRRALGWHVVAIALYIAATNATFTAFELSFRGDEAASFPASYARFLPQRAAFGLVTYGLVYAGCQIVHLYRDRQQQRVSNARLAEQLSEARLEMLRHQLRPHFLFNTLHAISTLMERDVAQSRRMVSLLAELLRVSLRGDETALVPLSRELEALDLYLEIESIRFQDRLRIERDVGADARDSLVPPFVLQPLAENAIVHGIGRSQSAGTLSIHASRNGGWLTLRVADDGPGDPNQGRPYGVGLGNLTERLAELYGRDAELSIESLGGGGFVATLTLPLRAAPAEVSS